MDIKKNAQAGTFESSDILVLVAPHDDGRQIELDSTVMLQYKDSIVAEIERILDEYDVENIHIIAKDKGALNATIAARVETAVLRGAEKQEGTSYA